MDKKLYKVTELQTILVMYEVLATSEDEAEEIYAFEGAQVGTECLECGVDGVELAEKGIENEKQF
jgi:hypothetical protein